MAPSCPALVALTAIAIVGFDPRLNYATKLNQAAGEGLKVAEKPKPVVADQSIDGNG